MPSPAPKRIQHKLGFSVTRGSTPVFVCAPSASSVANEWTLTVGTSLAANEPLLATKHLRLCNVGNAKTIPLRDGAFFKRSHIDGKKEYARWEYINPSIVNPYFKIPSNALPIDFSCEAKVSGTWRGDVSLASIFVHPGRTYSTILRYLCTVLHVCVWVYMWAYGCACGRMVVRVGVHVGVWLCVWLCL